MSLEDIRSAAQQLGADLGRTVQVVDLEDGWACLIFQDEFTPPEKGWPPTVDLILKVHQDFPKTGAEPSGFYVQPANFWGPGVAPRSRGDVTLPKIGPCIRLSWSPPGVKHDDLASFYRWMLARLWHPEG